MAILEASELVKEYQSGVVSVRALDGVDLVVEEGEFIAVMGPSGSGKSTLLHLLGGLDTASSGEVTLAGNRLSALNDKELTLIRRRNVGFIFQSYNLLPSLTVEENIALPLLIDRRAPKDYQERIERLLEWVKLTERRRHKPGQLSGGEQQRVAIARALVTEPAIILADEPTGNIDSQMGREIMELLRTAREVYHQTIVVVTHDPGVASWVDRVLVLKDGRFLNGATSQGSESLVREMTLER